MELEERHLSILLNFQFDIRTLGEGVFGRILKLYEKKILLKYSNDFEKYHNDFKLSKRNIIWNKNYGHISSEIWNASCLKIIFKQIFKYLLIWLVIQNFLFLIVFNTVPSMINSRHFSITTQEENRFSLGNKPVLTWSRQIHIAKRLQFQSTLMGKICQVNLGSVDPLIQLKKQRTQHMQWRATASVC